MGGPSQSTINTQNQLTQEQIGIANQQNELQQQNYQRMNTLEQPAISYYTGMTQNAATATQAAQPMISKISQGYNASKAQIDNTIPPGAARDLAKAQLEENQFTSIASAVNDQTLQSYDKLANLGAGLGSFSLQELGAAMGSLTGASGSNQQLGQMQAAASPWNAIGGLLGDAMSMFSLTAKV